MMRATMIIFGICSILMAVACLPESNAAEVNNRCEFDVTDYLTETKSSEATEFFEIAKSLDITVIQSAPQSIRADLRGADYDRSEARKYYEKAAGLGHVDAMNALAFFKLQGLGRTDDTYEEEPKEAFELYSKIAQHGDARGFQAMSAMLMGGFADQPADPKLATACMVRAALLADPNYLEPAYYLAEYDLGLYPTMKDDPLDEGPRMERGLTLLEDLLLKGYKPSYYALSLFYRLKDKRPDAREYFARSGAAAGAFSSVVVQSVYKETEVGRPDPDMVECLRGLTLEGTRDLEKLCPRPGGLLTREMAGLPPAPTAPLDIKAYLEDFAKQHPEQ